MEWGSALFILKNAYLSMLSVGFYAFILYDRAMIARLLLTPGNATFPTLRLDSDTLHYLKDVLRLELGGTLSVVVEGDACHDCEVLEIGRSTITVRQIKTTPIPESTFPTVTIIQSLVKQDKFKTVLNCCTQAEASAFWPVETTRSVAKISNLDHKMKRWSDIIYSAALQSQQVRCPTIISPCSFDDFLDRFSADDYDLCLVPWEDESTVSLRQIVEGTDRPQSIAIFIGPEGGFTANEIDRLREAGFQSASLGTSILRAQHAGIYTLGMLHYAYD